MKLKQLLSAALALTLGLTMAVPAQAAGKDQELERVTKTVKTTLSIPDDYTEFYGEPSEGPLGVTWNLRWTSEKKGCYVTATHEGKVLNLNRWEETESPYSYGQTYDPQFPAMTRQEAKALAQSFLDRVLTAGETAEVRGEGEDTLSSTSYWFQGGILLNGVASPLNFHLEVRLRDGQITSFYRDDPSQYAGTVPQAVTSTTAEQAGELLKTTLNMKLEYVLEGESKGAVLRYLPVGGDHYYVTAEGELVNLTELQKQLQNARAVKTGGGFFSSNDAAVMEEAPMAAEAKLTDTELAGVAKLEGVLDQEALEQAAKAWTALNLEGYAVASCNYMVDRETGEVTARVVFGRNADQGIYRRTVTLNAKTGELMSMYSSNPWTEEALSAVLNQDQARDKALSFLNQLWPSQLAKTQVYDAAQAKTSREVFSFQFAQQENGYFYPGNSISVQVDPLDGSIRGFSKNFDEEVTFDDAQGLVSLETAIAAWHGTYPVEFGYMAVPVALNLDEEPILYKPLVDAGYSYYEALRPGYGYGQREGWYLGVDAKTGLAVKGEEGQPQDRVAYSDVAGHWAEAILNGFAAYNVGWTGGQARPDAPLTQADFLAFLLSAEGLRFDLTTPDGLDQLYRTAVRRGFLTEQERNDALALDRLGMVKLLLDGLGYGTAAKLTGIYRTDYTDGASIPAALLGYAAIAQGLGMVKGPDFHPLRPATRAEGAALLWQYMKR